MISTAVTNRRDKNFTTKKQLFIYMDFYIQSWSMLSCEKLQVTTNHYAP